MRVKLGRGSRLRGNAARCAAEAGSLAELVEQAHERLSLVLAQGGHLGRHLLEVPRHDASSAARPLGVRWISIIRRSPESCSRVTRPSRSSVSTRPVIVARVDPGHVGEVGRRPRDRVPLHLVVEEHQHREAARRHVVLAEEALAPAVDLVAGAQQVQVGLAGRRIQVGMLPRGLEQALVARRSLSISMGMASWVRGLRRGGNQVVRRLIICFSRRKS